MTKSLIRLEFIVIFIALIIHEMQTLNETPATLNNIVISHVQWNYVLQIFRVNELKICSNTVVHG